MVRLQFLTTSNVLININVTALVLEKLVHICKNIASTSLINT